MLSTHGMMLANFQLKNKQQKTRFFQESFLMANIAIKVVIGMLFLTFSKIEIDFADREFDWKTYTLNNVLSTTK